MSTAHARRMQKSFVWAIDYEGFIADPCLTDTSPRPTRPQRRTYPDWSALVLGTRPLRTKHGSAADRAARLLLAISPPPIRGAVRDRQRRIRVSRTGTPERASARHGAVPPPWRVVVPGHSQGLSVVAISAARTAPAPGAPPRRAAPAPRTAPASRTAPAPRRAAPPGPQPPRTPRPRSDLTRTGRRSSRRPTTGSPAGPCVWRSARAGSGR